MIEKTNTIFADLPYKIRIHGIVGALEIFEVTHKLKQPTKVVTYAYDGIPLFPELFNKQCQDPDLILEDNLRQLRDELFSNGFTL